MGRRDGHCRRPNESAASRELPRLVKIENYHNGEWPLAGITFHFASARLKWLGPNSPGQKCPDHEKRGNLFQQQHFQNSLLIAVTDPD